MGERNGQPLVHARGLVKRFGELVAVDGVDFDLTRGEAFGFLGPNGAGKTSTMRMIGCVSPVSDGTLSVFGLDPARDGVEIRGRLGVVPQEDSLDMDLTVRENIVVYGRYFGLPRGQLRKRADELLDFVELSERANDRVEPLSGGMKRRLTIARSLVNEPEVLLLDEPTTGLDPQARHVVWDRLYRLKRRGVTLLLTTHYMDEAEQLCDRLVVMDHGQIVAEGSPLELIDRYSTREVVELRFDEEPPVRRHLVGRRARLARRIAPRPGPALHRRRRRRGASAPRARARPGERARAAEHPRGRLSPSHRPEPDRMTTLVLAARPLEFFFAQYRRVWRGTAVSSIVTPVVYLLALGIGLGSFVGDVAFDGTTYRYVEFVAPGLLAATAMQVASFESSWPVLSAIKWSRQYHAMLATPLRVRDVLAGHQAWVALRVFATATVYFVVIALPPFDAVVSWWGDLAIPTAVLVGLAFSAPIAAWGARAQIDSSFVALFRFVILPMFLFSGTFPDQPASGRAGDRRVRDSSVARGQPVSSAHPRADRRPERARERRLPRDVDGRRALRRPPHLSPKARSLMAELTERLLGFSPAQPRIGGLLIVERNAMVYRRTWMILFSGFFEPLFYLLAFGVGLGSYVGTVGVNGQQVDYDLFLASSLLAASAMNGAFYDATNVFWKLRYAKVYDAMLSTPVRPADVAVGETMWAVVRSLLYSTAFLTIVAMLGLIHSWWALLVLPCAFVIGFAFAGAGIAAVTFMRSWQDFEFLQLVMLPMFLFSATFYPISVYPTAIEWLVRVLPLYNGISLMRALMTGSVGVVQLANVIYLAALGIGGMFLASRRIDALLLK